MREASSLPNDESFIKHEQQFRASGDSVDDLSRDDIKRLKKELKRARKKEKKEKKHGAKSRHHGDGQRVADMSQRSDTLYVKAETSKRQATEGPGLEPPPTKKMSKASFFASLIATEASKPPIGTFHATGRRDTGHDEASKDSGDWECHKCFYKNFKESLTCAKCRALRRYEGRNQPSGYCQ